MAAELLNRAFGIPGRLSFRAIEGGLVVADVTTFLSTASISLQGGHLMTWQPRHAAKPVIKLTDLAQLLPGKAIRGGIPICWPWFGPHATESAWPAHGYARAASWQMSGVALQPDETMQIDLQLSADAAATKPWHQPAKLTFSLQIGHTLKLTLTTQNTGRQGLSVSEALHTYLYVADVERVEVSGLDGCGYVDKVRSNQTCVQDGTLRLSGETDRVYLDTTSDCVVTDAGLGRRIRVTKSGSRSTVIWNPWQEKASGMGDVGADGWRDFLCVETANALSNSLTLAPGESHTLVTEISVEESK